jgi:hypothetical protein
VVNGAVELIPGDVAVNREQQMVTGSFRIKGDKLPAIPITVGATLHKMVWNQKSLSYSELPCQDLYIFSGTVVPAQWPDPILYSFKMPNDEGLYKITLNAESDVGVAVRKTDEAQQFNTYLPANVVIKLNI